jgi:hypothetical protein
MFIYKFKTIKTKVMKKVMAILTVVAVTVVMASCGNKQSNTDTTVTDSTAVATDSSAVIATDSTVAEITTEADVK